jgi:hypothetical protein
LTLAARVALAIGQEERGEMREITPLSDDLVR